MRLLLDTHTFLWFLSDDAQLSAQAHGLWEMAIKISLGKLRLSQPFDPFISEQLTLNAIKLLDITLAHTVAVIPLPFHHRDPIDRLLIAQALTETMHVVDADTVFDAYGVTRLW